VAPGNNIDLVIIPDLAFAVVETYGPALVKGRIGK
jgi:hypothetical protein